MCETKEGIGGVDKDPAKADPRTERRQGFEDGMEMAAQLAENRHIVWHQEQAEVCCDVTACQDIAATIRRHV